MRPAPLAAAALLATLALATAAAAAPAGPAATTPRERARAVALAAELEAARQPTASTCSSTPRGDWLDLKAHGVTLRRFPVSGARFGQPRFAAGAPAWPAASFELASELPEPERPRVPIQPAAEESAGTQRAAVETAGQADPLARRRQETMALAPTHYRLRFEPGLEVSVRGEAGRAPLAGRVLGLSLRAAESLGAGLRRLVGRPLPPRVVLKMTPEDAQRLHLALLPRMRLVIHVPESA